MSNIITKNGRVINLHGSLSMCGNKWYLDGKEVNINELASEVKEDDKSVYITINLGEGSSIGNLEIDSCKTISINGNCKRIHTQMGDITVYGDVDGDVHANMGNIECGNVDGCVKVNMGNINYKK